MSSLILSLQQGLAITSEPYAQMGLSFGLTGDEVLAALAQFTVQGVARRFGAVFNVSQLGYQSALCAIQVSSARLEAVGAMLVPHPGITHCYSRSANDEHLPNLWFTLSTLAEHFAEELARLQSQISEPIHVLPATRKFKVQVVLDPDQLQSSLELDIELPAIGSHASPIVGSHVGPFVGTQAVATTQAERNLIRLLHQFPTVAKPFALIASKLSLDESEVLTKLQTWKELGVLRRIGLLVKHQQIGFVANAMCTWQVAPERVEAVGSKLAARREITHCYERSTFANFPYNIYAMIHSQSDMELKRLAQDISQQIETPLGRMFMSEREFKKTSLVPFRMDD